MLMGGLPNTHESEAVVNLVLALFKKALPAELIETIGNQLRGDLATVWRTATVPEEPGTRLRPVVEVPEDITDLLPVVREVAVTLETARLPYAVGGGLALEAYGVRKSTADIDFFVKREDADEALSLLRGLGYHTQHTSEEWIYKAFYEFQVVDFIFASSVGLPIDDEILERAVLRSIAGFAFRVLSPEDIALFKIPLVVNPFRRDWDDLIALLPKVAPIDWDYLLQKGSLPPSLLLSFLLVWKERQKNAPIPEDVIQRLQARLGTEYTRPPREEHPLL